METFNQNDPPPPKSERPSTKAILTHSEFNSQTSIEPKFFRKGQIAWWDNPPTSSNRPYSEHVKAFSQDNNPVSVSTSPIRVYKAPFTNSSYAYRTQEWFNLAKNDVLCSRKAPPLASVLVGWLVGWFSNWEIISFSITTLLHGVSCHSGRAVWGVGLGRLVAGIVGSNPAQGMDVCPHLSVVCCPV
jgi:hypothetical protein